MTFSQPLRICDPCKDGHHEDCAENIGLLHEGHDYQVCWCIQCGWASSTNQEKDGS